VYVAEQTITVRVDASLRKELRRQINHIRQGLREADAGKFASSAEVKRVLRALRRTAISRRP